MIWPFRKRKPRLIDRRVMNEDWRVGDLARCVDDEWLPKDAIDPKINDVLRVSEVMEGQCETGPILMFGLRFEGKPSNRAWAALAFRKIRQVQTAADQSFREWLREALRRPASVPVKEPVA